MSKRNILILTFSAIIFFVAVALLLHSNSFRITSTTPGDNEKKVDVETQIILETNRVLLPDNKTFNYSVEPFDIEGEISFEGTRIIIKPVGILRESQEYTIFFRNIISNEGELIESYELNFTTAIDNTARGELIRKLPHVGVEYELDYSYLLGTFTVRYYESDLSTVQTNVEQYIESFNLDPGSLNIEYEKARVFQSSGAPPFPEEPIEEGDESSVN